MKAYLAGIAYLQEALLWLSFVLIIVLSSMVAYAPDILPRDLTSFLYEVSLFTAFLVLAIRPLADLFPAIPYIRPLVILRKGVGVFSASIIGSFMFAKFMVQGFDYIATFFSPAHWSLTNYAILSPLADISAIILLITSNKFSKRILGINWKRIHKLAYIYFYAGALYEYLVLSISLALWLAGIALTLAVAAFFVKRMRAPIPQPA